MDQSVNGPKQSTTAASLTQSGPTPPSDDIALFEYIARHLYTAVISDTLDDLGYRDQAMREYLRPLDPAAVFAGRARTINCADVFEEGDDPYGVEIEAIDSLRPGEIPVVAAGRSLRNAPWGELLSTAAKARGARGAVVDGLVRDVRKICDLGFPVVAAGVKPVDSRGRGVVVSYDTTVQCGGVTVRSGDVVVSDLDGVVVIPQSVVRETVSLAADKVARENGSRDELKAGRYLRDVFEKYGVL